jgi:hypothetical protein
MSGSTVVSRGRKLSLFGRGEGVGSGKGRKMEQRRAILYCPLSTFASGLRLRTIF